MPMYDYVCSYCSHTLDDELRNLQETVKCPECDHVMDRGFPAPKTLIKIVPSYPGAKARKAGYIHRYQNQPATRPQVGYGGSATKGGRSP